MNPDDIDTFNLSADDGLKTGEENASSLSAMDETLNGVEEQAEAVAATEEEEEEVVDLAELESLKEMPLPMEEKPIKKKDPEFVSVPGGVVWYKEEQNQEYEIEVHWGKVLVHHLPMVDEDHDKPNSILARKLKSYGITVHPSVEGDDDYEEIARAIAKGMLLQGDMEYASMLINGLLASSRSLISHCQTILGQVKNTGTVDEKMAEASKEHFNLFANVLKEASKFQIDTKAHRDSTFEMLYRKHNTTRKTYTDSQPKKSYQDGQYKYVDTVEELLVVKSPLWYLELKEKGLI